jgi:hypothetical protein
VGSTSDDMAKWVKIGTYAMGDPGIGTYLNKKLGILQPKDRSARAARKKHPEIEAEAGEAADLERRRRAAGSQRRTILTGALGPASSRGSILSGG